MKIKKLHHKRLNFPPQDVQSLREEIEAAPNSKIHEVLQPFQEWPFVRGDMYHWIPVLNRFDEIMAEASEKYKLTELQETDFDSSTQQTLVNILHFSRLLLENCINRNLYSSVDRLECLLNTSDPTVLENTLRVLLRASQRWSYQRDLRANQAVMSSRLITLADPWHVKKDVLLARDADESIVSHTNEFRLLARDQNTQLLKTQGEAIRYQFFRTAEDLQQLEKEAAGAGALTRLAATPDTRKRASGGGESGHRKTKKSHLQQSDAGRSTNAISEGLVSIHVQLNELGIDRSAPVSQQMHQVVSKLVEKYKVPRTDRYELRHRVFVALAFATGDSELRFTLLRSRIYAAAILSQLMNEREFKNAFLSREPNFTADIIGVLQPEVHAPLSVQTTVFLALESLLKQRSEVSGAYVALNASANHGVLMFILRKAFADVDGPPVYPYEFMSALYFFLTGMANNMNGGQLLVSAGVVPIFVSALKHTHLQQLRSVGRVAKLLDYLISSTNATFPAFCSANGIATLVERIESEVHRAVAISEANPEAAADLSSPVKLPRFSEYPKQLYRRREIMAPEHIYLLKELFKLLTHLVQQPSYHDRLRNLVETSLPQTLRTVFTHPTAFGSNIYGMAISISSMMVHNEPTSLPIIQEARLPETLLENLERHIPYNSDVIMNIPGALGAFCLNDAGMEQVRKSSIISNVLKVFYDVDFIRILQEGDVTGSFGASLDEFMRHFPAVKELIMDQIILMLKAVLEMGQLDSPIVKVNPGNTFLLRSAAEEEIKPYYDDFYGMMLESVTTFLEGLLEQRAHSTMFIDRGGWDLITQAISSPLLPFNFVKSRTFESLHGLASTLLDTAPERVFKALFKVASDSLNASVTAEQVWHGAKYLELAKAAELSEAEYQAANTELHYRISCTGAIALITYLTNGSGGGSLARCIKVVDDVMPRDEFAKLVSSVCDAYCSEVQKAVAIEHTISTLPEPSDAKKADKKSSSKGKEVEGSSSSAAEKSMDVDENAPVAVEPYVRTNYLNLGEVSIAFALEAGQFIECMSNSLRLSTSDEEGLSKAVSDELSETMVRFVINLLGVCQDFERNIIGAHLVEQAMVAIMKAMLFVRHRIYTKLRVFVRFVDQNGLQQFCQLLQTMWDWAASVVPPLPEGEDAAMAISDSDVKLCKALESMLESMLSILSFFVDGEPILESPEFPSLVVEHDENRGWFRAGDFIVNLRLTALPTLQKIWESPLLVYGDSSLMQAFIACLEPIIAAQHETRSRGLLPGIRRHLPSLLDRQMLQRSQRGSGTQTPIPALARALGSLERSSPLSRTPTQPEATVELNSAYVSELESLGFTNEQAEDALRRNANSLSRAANDLFSTVLSGRGQQQQQQQQQEGTSSQPENDTVEPQSQNNTASDEPAAEEPSAEETSGSNPAVEEDVQSSQGAQPMSVDSPESDEESSSDSDNAQPSAKKGIEPFSSTEWREAQDAKEDENRQKLKQAREALSASIAPRVIALIDEFKSKAVVQVQGVLELALRKNEAGPTVHMLVNALTPLLDAVTVSDSDVDQRLAAHTHMWALLLSQGSLMDEIYQHAKGLGQHAIRALGIAIQRSDKSPSWLTTLLLVVELLLQQDNEPPKKRMEERSVLTQTAKRRLTKLPPSSVSINEAAEAAASSTGDGGPFDQLLGNLATTRQPSGSAFEPASSSVEESAEAPADETKQETEPMFDLAQKVELQVLATQFFSTPVPEYTPIVLNSLLRLVVVLTRSSEFAVEFMESSSLANAVRTMRRLSPTDTPSISEVSKKEKTPLGFVNAIMSVTKEQQKGLRQERTLVVHVLRHAIEGRPVLRLLMENLVQGWFESPQFSSSDVNTYVRGTMAYGLRDPELFTRVTADRCYMPSYNDEMRVSWMTLAWQSSKLLDEEEVDRFEALPEGALEEAEKTDEADKTDEVSTASREFLGFLEKKKQEKPFDPYELDAESEQLACKIAEFFAEELLSLRPPISRAVTTADIQVPQTPTKQPRTSSYTALSSASGTAAQPSAFTADESPELIAYRCFLLQCLAEMIASFPFTLQAVFVARNHGTAGLFSPRKDKGKGKAPATSEDRTSGQQQQQQQQSLLRVRSPLISHLVHVLVVREAVTSAKASKKNKADVPTEGSELEQAVAIAEGQIAIKRGQLSRNVTFWATSLLATMCVRHQEGWSTTACRDSSPGDGSNEITLMSLRGNYDRALSAARQLTLDHIVRAYRECLSASTSGPGGADVIYARLTALAHLTNKLVMARPISHGRSPDSRTQAADKQTGEGANVLKKMILERGVLDLLTAACSRLNLNHPQSREMLNVFMRPMEHLAKAAVKISREAVLEAWEESGQEKMPLEAGQRGFNMDLFEDENAALDEDEDIPPDLYENSALGLHQNQGTGEPYDPDALMEEDYDDEFYDDDNSSVSDIDTEDEVLEDDIMLEGDDNAEDDDGMEMDTIMHEGEADEDEDEDDDDSDSSMSSSDDGDESDGEGSILTDNSGEGSLDIDRFRFALDNAINMLHDEDEQALQEEEERLMDAESYFTGDDSNHGDHDDGWHTELSDAEPSTADATLHRRRAGHARNAASTARSRPVSAGGSRDPLAGAGDGHSSRTSSRADNDVEPMAEITPSTDDAINARLTSSEAESDGSGDADSFVDDFPDTLEITMEAIDEHGNSEPIQNSDLSNFILDTLASTMGDDGFGLRGGMRGNGLAGLGHGRPLGVVNGASTAGFDLLQPQMRDTLEFNMSRLPRLGRPGLAVGGVNAAAGQSMAHPLVSQREVAAGGGDRNGMQARAERLARGTLNRPLRSTPDDVYELGQSMATRLSTALSSGRRPAYTHRLVPGPSNRMGPTPWTESGVEGSAGMGSSVAGALHESNSQALATFEHLVRMCWAAAAIDCYTPLSTVERWQEEVRIQYGGRATDFVSRLTNPILNELIPKAICQNLLRSRYQVEIMRRTAIADRKKMEREDEERRQREEEARLAEEARLREEDAKRSQEAADEASQMAVDDDAESEASENDDEEPQHEDAPAGPSEPLIVTVDGEQVDITDMGIDMEFLLALPDDLRMEVIESRREELRIEQRQQQQQPGAEGTDNNEGFLQEFLDALPVEIRDEVLESGPLQRQLLERDGASFMRFGSQLPLHSQQQQQQQHRGSSPEVDAQSSPLEAAVRDRVRIGTRSGTAGRGAASGADANGQTEQSRVREKRRKKIASRDIAVQLLSSSELAALSRFIFLPNHALSSTLMMRIVQCVCENGRTRSQFIHLMLSILDSNATSLGAVDTVIRQALLAEQPADTSDPGAKTPQRGGPRSAGIDSSIGVGTPAAALFTAALVQQTSAEFSFPLSELRSDVPAYVPAQRCLETLHSLAAHNPRAAMHFLVEHHGLRKRNGDPVAEPQSAESDDESRFPVVHLLRLLVKPLYYSHGSAITELLMQLLSTVTKPLGSMVRRNRELQQQPLEPSDAAASSLPRAAVPLPGIPGSALRAIVNVVAAGECTSRTFQHTLSLIQNLSHLPGVLPIVTDELITRASALSEGVCADIAQLQDVLQALPPPGSDEAEGESEGVPTELLDRVRDITLAQFSPASSHQSRLLRLLMAIDYVSTTVAKRLEEKERARMEVDSDPMPRELMHLRSLALGHDAQFLPLWEAAGQCLQYTSAHAELAHVATVLLPLIESFMVVFKPVVGERSKSEADMTVISPASSQSVPTAGESYFQNFTEKHKKVLNALVRNNPGLLSGSFSLLVFNPHVLDFDNKRSYFYQRLHDDSSSGSGSSNRRHSARPLGHIMQVNVRRSMVFEDSYHQFTGKSGDEIKRARINVKFRDEEGVDAGGVSREWFQALARQMFNPGYALFKPSASGRVTYQPNPQSWANPEHLMYFKFVGRIIGKAIVDQRVLDAYFTRSFYKHILGRKVDYRDMEAIDPSYYKSLEWILENDITDVFEETFSIEVDDFGQHRIIDLIPNGQEITVTEDNKAEYVRLVTEQRLYLAIKDQINAFLTGFHDVIPKELVQIFNEQELELLISGMPDIDVDDWRNNTEYHGGYNSSSAQIQWFWRAVRSFDQEERAKLLQFVTGTSKVPLEGFAHLQGNQGVQKFQIHKDFASPTRLPTAHTCFNQLDLPLYENFDSLKSNLLLAISECSTGFGFV
ncbi:E3 ubiquitin-protein ligase tom1 [Coemansia sp. RSA 990]|nr:E3 ubiquitin-protein ligase tom1 [Coemansia sp. RSA 990]